mmetsp:Transcript_18435/g.62154  ORF Transcript_18435/g.62154 Transcript_18435/m.62154 type:complete len:206 (+) Transcript_18435:464-1081(+)
MVSTCGLYFFENTSLPHRARNCASEDREQSTPVPWPSADSKLAITRSNSSSRSSKRWNATASISTSKHAAIKPMSAEAGSADREENSNVSLRAMPLSKKMAAACPKTRLQPGTRTKRKFCKSGKVVLAEASESKEPKPSMVMDCVSAPFGKTAFGAAILRRSTSTSSGKGGEKKCDLFSKKWYSDLMFEATWSASCAGINGSSSE